jgi:plastocyanin
MSGSREIACEYDTRGVPRTWTGYCGRKLFSGLVTIALVAAAAACGSGSASPSPTGPTPSPTPSPAGPPTVRISAAGLNPIEITIRVGDRVTFINDDAQPHDVAGGPDIAHPDCREIDAVGFLVTGQSRQTAPLPEARTCDYHDHSNHAPIFNGRIIIR